MTSDEQIGEMIEASAQNHPRLAPKKATWDRCFDCKEGANYSYFHRHQFIENGETREVPLCKKCYKRMTTQAMMILYQRWTERQEQIQKENAVEATNGRSSET